jgi:hypothetical protein
MTNELPRYRNAEQIMNDKPKTVAGVLLTESETAARLSIPVRKFRAAVRAGRITPDFTAAYGRQKLFNPALDRLREIIQAVETPNP